MRRGLGQDRAVRGAAAAAGAAAATVEDGQHDVVLRPRRARGRRVPRGSPTGRRGSRRPSRSPSSPTITVSSAAVLVEPACEGRRAQQLVEDPRGVREVGDRLEERCDRDVAAGGVGERVRRQHVLGARGPGEHDRVERLASVLLLGRAYRGERRAQPVVGRPHLLGVDADVEPRDVQPEHGDAPAQRRQAAVGDACADVVAQARVDQVEIGRELGRARVSGLVAPGELVVEPPPDRRQLAPVGLVRGSAPRSRRTPTGARARLARSRLAARRRRRTSVSETPIARASSRTSSR